MIMKNKHIDIILVTHKPRKEVKNQIQEIEYNTPESFNLTVTCQGGKSAAVNRNYGLERVESDIFVMMDDDITGFYEGWLTDFVQPMIDDKNIILSTIRCLRPDGGVGPMMCCGGIPIDKGVYDAIPCGYKDYRRVPTACIAVRKNNIRFDEGFVGSGYEDSDFMNNISRIFPGHRFVVNNNCKLIHLNTMQNQGGKYWEHNKKLYLEKWPDDTTVQGQTDWTV
jgi:hypothetical protein